MMRSRIERTLDRLHRPETTAELAEVYHRVTGETPGTDSSLRVIVVSSLCGGTGAGLLKKVCDIIDDRSGSAVMAYLYMAEVFEALGSASTGGMQPNSLATICEILNGRWWNDYLTDSGPAIPFLVGRVNTRGVAYDTPGQVFAATAQRLAHLVTNKGLQEFIAYQLSGWNTSMAEGNLMGSGMLVDEGDSGEVGLPVFGAVGFARLSTGVDYFEAYSARCLVREALVDVVSVHADQEIAGAILEQLEFGWEGLGVAPPRHEFTLIAPDEYPTLFESMLGESDSSDLAEELRETIRELVQREDSLGESPTDLVNNLRAEIGGLEDRAKQWLRRPGTVFGDFLNLSLRSYLGESSLRAAGQTSEQEYDRRCLIFVAQMSAALDSAEPLVKIDASLMGLVHPRSRGLSDRSISQFPFQGHPIEEQTKTDLRVAGIGDADVDRLFSADDSVKHIDIHTTLGPHSVLVFESLLKPIAKQWSKMVASGRTRQFWSHRRAQPIANFTPAPQALVHCMVRGWYTGVLLGLIDHAAEEDGPVTIARSDNMPAKFPFPYLSNGYGVVDRLAQVLEGLGLAYVKVSELGHLEPLEAYCALRDLGRADPGAGLYGYHQLSPALQSWIATGEFGKTIAVPFLEAAESPTDRAKGLENFISEFKESLEEEMAQQRTRWRRHASALSGPPLWTGLYRISDRELLNLEMAVKQYRKGTSQVKKFG